MAKVARSLSERFWPNVAVPDKNNPDACREWRAGRDRGGYGVIRAGKRGDRHLRAHRVAWELARGPIPPGLCVLHRCDVRACVNPDHLFLGTNEENMRDMVAKGRQARKLTETARLEIRRAAAAGVTHARIASTHGVCAVTVWRVLARARAFGLS